VKEDPAPPGPSGHVTAESAEFRQLVDRLERADTLIESLTNRTNTLVHLLDILNKRVDRLEARAGT
jgi:hypothetical protein